MQGEGGGKYAGRGKGKGEEREIVSFERDTVGPFYLVSRPGKVKEK